MKTFIEGSPSFAYMHVDLDPGESIVTESDAMSSMASDLDMKAATNGGFFSGLCKKMFADESFFVSIYKNNTNGRRRVTLSPGLPGDINVMHLNGNGICLTPGAFLASTPGVKLGVAYAGVRSMIAREGLVRLYAHGEGTVWYTSFGGLLEKDITGPYVIDSGFLVAYEPQIKIKLALPGGIFSSFFGGEGIVMRLEGRGRIAIQTRSLSEFANWVNPKLL